MKKETKTHIVYGVILLLLILGISSYEYIQAKNITQALAAMETSLEGKITAVDQSVKNLGQDLKKAQKDISGLSSSLEEKETKIQSLSGQLEEVRTESLEQLGELSDKITNLKLQNQDFSEVIENSIPAVVSVRTDSGSGSGFLIRQNGYIVTNNHVIVQARAATIVTSDGDGHGVYLVGADADADIAVLKIDGEGYTLLRFGDSDEITVGEKAIAIGNPGGLDFTVTQGIISAVDREDANGNMFVQIDVPINPGNSGGPLINAAGKVIGVTTKKVVGFEGVGFALESNQVEEIANNLIAEYEENLLTGS